MRLIFHIGMGKTGTTSIQAALLESSAGLIKKNIEYIGMWFDFLGIEQKRYAGIHYIVGSPPDEQRRLAELFAEKLDQRVKAHNIETFIFSNEGLFAAGFQSQAFFARLRELTDLRLIAYLRDPHEWLQSAYAQWGISHKTQPGRIVSFEESAPRQIQQYSAIRAWVETFGDILTVRLHEKGRDVVEDFFYQLGLEYVPNQNRKLERYEPAELLFRAMYNDRISAPVLPEQFNRVVMNPAKGVGSAKEMANRCMTAGDVNQIVEEQRQLFEYVKDKFGFDFLVPSKAATSVLDAAALQRGLIDLLIETVFQQGESLLHLERTVAELKGHIGAIKA